MTVPSHPVVAPVSKKRRNEAGASGGTTLPASEEGQDAKNGIRFEGEGSLLEKNQSPRVGEAGSGNPWEQFDRMRGLQGAKPEQSPRIGGDQPTYSPVTKAAFTVEKHDWMGGRGRHPSSIA